MEQKQFRIGFLGFMAFTGALLIFFYGITFQTPANTVLVPAVLMGVIGFSFAFILVQLRVDPFELRDFVSTIMWTGICVGVIYLVNRAIPLRMEAFTLNPRLFAVLLGVMEEMFFRVWLAPMIYKFTGNFFLALIISALMWSVYHLNRYGGSINSLFIVFFAGIVLGSVILLSRRADAPIFAHGIVNYLATPQ